MTYCKQKYWLYTFLETSVTSETSFFIMYVNYKG